MIAVITGLIVVIRIAEIFIDPLLGNLVDNTTTKVGPFPPVAVHRRDWSPPVLIVLIFSGMFGLVNVNTTLFIVLFVITFIVLDVFLSLRDISYWGMIPALSSDSHERSTYTAPLAPSPALSATTASPSSSSRSSATSPETFTGAKGQGQAGWTSFGFIVALLGPDYRLRPACAFGTKERHQRAACQGPEERQPVRGVQGAVPERPAAVGRPVLPAVRHRKRHHDRWFDVLPLRVFVLERACRPSPVTGIIPLIARGFIMAPAVPDFLNHLDSPVATCSPAAWSP